MNEEHVSKAFLINLPLEIHFIIFEHLLQSPTSFSSLSISCKSVRQSIIAWNPWRRLLLRYFRFKNESTNSSLELEAANLLSESEPSTIRASPRNDINNAYRHDMELFTSKFQFMRKISRGYCSIRGNEVICGSATSTQMSNNEVFGSFGTDCITSWSISTGEVVTKYEGHTMPVVSVQVNDFFVVSGSFDKTVRIWSRQSGKQIHCIETSGVVKAILFNSVEIVCGDTLGYVYVIETVSGLVRLRIPNDCLYLTEVSHIRFDDRFILSSSDRTVQVYDRIGGRILFYTNEFSSLITTVTLSEKVVAIGTWNGAVHVYSLAKSSSFDYEFDNDKTMLFQISKALLNPVVEAYHGHTERINCIQILPKAYTKYFHKEGAELDSTLSSYPVILTASNDSKVCLWGPRRHSPTSFVHYEPIFRLLFESTVLSVEIVPKIELNLLILTAACLDGKLSHWHISMNDKTSGLSGENVEVISDENRCAAIKIGSQTTFGSSFLPFMIYQEFIQLLLDRNANDARTVNWQTNVTAAINRTTNNQIEEALEEENLDDLFGTLDF